MTKLTAETGAEKHALDIRREGERVFAEVDGRCYELLLLREPEAGTYLLLADHHVYECRVEQDQSGGAPVRVHLRNRAYEIRLTDPKRLRAGESAGAQSDGAAQITAPMPGKVVRVLIEQGASVEAGQGLVVVEAMKMQNEMKAPRAGRVAELHAVAGATVNAGDLLVRIE